MTQRRVKAILKSGGLMFVGEAPGEQEAKLGIPFVGPSGKLFDNMLRLAGIERGEVSITNVFDVRPPENNLYAWCVSGSEEKKRITEAGFHPVGIGSSVIRADLLVPALERLRAELSRVNPKCVVTLGNIATQAVCGMSGIKNLRGSLLDGVLYSCKVIPTYHPAAVLRQMGLLPIVVLDLRKARHESRVSGSSVRNRKIFVPETLEDVRQIEFELSHAGLITFDIETKGRQVSCIGLCHISSRIFVIPFMRRNGSSYWPSLEQELQVWKSLKNILESPVPKLAHNGMFDVQHLLAYGIRVRNFQHDTMLLQHALFPSLPKSLEFLGSLYCNEKAWKRLRFWKGEKSEE